MIRFLNYLSPSGSERFRGRKFNRIATLFVFCSLLLAFLATTGCEIKLDNKKDKDENENESIAVPVRAIPVTKDEISEYLTLNGVLEPKRHVNIFAQASGIVLDIKCEEGDLVNENQVLVRLEDSDQQLALKRAETLLKREEQNFQRSKELFAKELLSEDSFISVQTALRDAQLALEQAELALSRCEIRAPFSGIIAERLVQKGDRVDLGKPLFTLVDRSELLLNVWVSEENTRLLKPGKTGELQIENMQDNHYYARLLRISPVVDQTYGKVKATFQISGEYEQLKPGQFVEIELKLETHYDVIVIPKNAVIYESGIPSVFIMQDTLAFRRRVQPGIQTGDHIEILQGINLSDSLIIQGQSTLQDSSVVEIYSSKAE